MEKIRHLLALIITSLLLFASCNKNDEKLDNKEDELVGEFSFEITSTDYRNPVAVVTPSESFGDGTYLVGVVPQSDYADRYGEDLTKVARYVIDCAEEARVASGNVYFDIVDDRYVFGGVSEVLLTYWCPIESEKEYVVVAFGADVDGTVTSKISSTLMTTTYDSDQLILSVINTSIDNIQLSVTAKPTLGMYYLAPIPTAELEYSYYGDPSLAISAAIAEHVAILAEHNTPEIIVDNAFVYKGDYFINLSDWWYLSEETEYTIMACGIKDNGDMITDVYTTTATTLPSVPKIDGTFELTHVESTPTSITVDVVRPESMAGNNYVVAAFNATSYDEALYSWADALADYITEDLVTGLFDFSKVDNEILFSDDSATITLDKIATPYATGGIDFIEGCEYVIAAFGVDDQGRYNTEVSILYAYTTYSPEPEVTGSLSLTVDAVAVDNIYVSVEEIGAVNNYAVAACPMANYRDDYGEDINKLVEAVCDVQIADELALPDEARVFSESAKIALAAGWPISARTEYIIVAFGIARDTKEPTTEPVYAFTTTPTPELSDNVITIDCGEIETNSVVLTTTATNEEDPYYITVVTADKVEGKSDEEIYNAIIDPYGESFAATVYFEYGNLEDYLLIDLYADTKYYAVAFVYEYGTYTSEIFLSEPFTTKAIEGEVDTPTADEIILSTVDFGEITAEVNYYDPGNGDPKIFMGTCNVVVAPADDNVKYFVIFMESKDVVESDQEFIAQYYETVKRNSNFTGDRFIEELQKEVIAEMQDTSGLSDEEYEAYLNRNTWLRKGEYVSNQALSPNVEYTICAYGIDTETLQPTTAVERFNYTYSIE
ncbi:MAG: hypothetical protein R3Y08_07055 [Rikenellaceae bacterium]